MLNYSLKKKLLIFFFVATWHHWITPILLFIYLLFVNGGVIFQLTDQESHIQVLRIIEQCYYKYIYLFYGEMSDVSFYKTKTPFFLFLSIFHILSFVLLIVLLVKEKIKTTHKILFVLIALSLYYFIGFFIYVEGVLLYTVIIIVELLYVP